MGDQIRIPRVAITIFFFFFPSFSAELPSLCYVISSIYQLFVPHFAMAIFNIIYTSTTSFEFSSILLTVDLSKHLIKAWIVRKFIQLVNFMTFSVFFLFFFFSGNRYGQTYMSEHFWEMSYVLTKRQLLPETAWDNCGIWVHLSRAHNLSQALTTGLPAKLNSA